MVAASSTFMDSSSASLSSPRESDADGVGETRRDRRLVSDSDAFDLDFFLTPFGVDLDVDGLDFVALLLLVVDFDPDVSVILWGRGGEKAGLPLFAGAIF